MSKSILLGLNAVSDLESLRRDLESQDVGSAQWEVIVLDLSDLPHLDSTVLSALVRLKLAGDREGVPLRLTGLNDLYRAVFRHSNLQSMFDLEEAEDSTMSQPPHHH